MEEDDLKTQESMELRERMDTVQALLNSLQGRSDALSMSTKESLGREMSELRIRCTKSKPIAAQVVVLEGLVSRKQKALAEAQLAAQLAQQKMVKLLI